MPKQLALLPPRIPSTPLFVTAEGSPAAAEHLREFLYGRTYTLFRDERLGSWPTSIVVTGLHATEITGDSHGIKVVEEKDGKWHGFWNVTPSKNPFMVNFTPDYVRIEATWPGMDLRIVLVPETGL